MADDDPIIKRIPINLIRVEEGAREIGNSPEMEPYRQFMVAAMRNFDATEELEAIRQLPLEKRYIWRVATALKWAFADSDSVVVQVDKKTLKPEDFAKVLDLLKLRPMQFCMFLSDMLGPDEMQRLMSRAIKMARGNRAN